MYKEAWILPTPNKRTLNLRASLTRILTPHNLASSFTELPTLLLNFSLLLSGTHRLE